MESIPSLNYPSRSVLLDALKKVETVISFATFPDETALMADYIFPDHHGLESFGYQRVATGADASVLSGMQPVVSPFHDTRATADVLLAAAALPYADEFAFIQSKLEQFVPMNGGSFAAPEINTFMAYFQQHGGWWMNGNALVAPASSVGALKLPGREIRGGRVLPRPVRLADAGRGGREQTLVAGSARPDDHRHVEYVDRDESRNRA